MNAENLDKVVYTAEVVARSLDTILELLQKIQAIVPVPTLEDVAEIRQGERPLTQEAYLHGVLHRSTLAAENLISDLRATDLETLSSVHELSLSGIELNAIEQAVAELTHGREGNRLEPA